MTEEQRARFSHLRQRESEGDSLSPAEQAELAELAELIRQIEETEASYLRPANERLRAERLALEEQNRALRALVSHTEMLAFQLRAKIRERNGVDRGTAA